MSGGSKKKSGSKKAKAEAAANESTNDSNSLVRPPNSRSINPRSILTGFYQKNGKRVQHFVQDGALQMPKDSLDVIAKATGNYNKQDSKYKLPGLDSVVRPCLDPKLETMVVTELVMEKVQIAQEQKVPPVPSTIPGMPAFQPPPIVKMIKVSRPSATNKTIRRVPTKQAGAERIRGGGDAPPPPNQQTTIPPAVPVAAVPVAVAAPVVPAAAPAPVAPPAPTTTNDVVMAGAPATTSAMNPPPAPVKPTIPAPVATTTSSAVAPAAQQPVTTVSTPAVAAPIAAPTPAVTQAVPMSVAPVPISKPAPAVASMPHVAVLPSTTVVPAQPQPTPAPTPTPAVVAPTAPTPALSSVTAPVVAKPTAAPASTSLVAPAPVAPIPVAPVAPVVKPSVAVAKPAIAPAPTPVAPAVKPTTVKTEAIAPSPATTTPAPAPASAAPQPAAAVPVVASSTPVVKPAATPQVKVEEKKPAEKVPEAKALAAKPKPQWDQHKPGPNDETITPENQLPPMPEWYKKDGINEIERTMLPEWFDSSSSHRTPESYVKTREKIIEMSVTLSNRNVTNTMIRRSILGDAGSLQRLRSFLVNWGVINRDGINDSAPTTASLRPGLKRSAKFTNDMKDTLILAVTEQASKKRKLMVSPTSPSPTLSLDWEEIAAKVGSGVTAESCRETFMTAPLKEETSNSMDVTDDSSPSSKSEEELIQSLVANSNPEVVKKVCDAAMEASGFNSVETRAASLLGLQLTQALETARGHEVDLAVKLSKLLDTRMQKLENRMAMMDDVEGILEAEKLALEMERRDLYTARCRHWFGGV